MIALKNSLILPLLQSKFFTHFAQCHNGCVIFILFLHNLKFGVVL